MRMSIADAAAQLTDLVERAVAGEEVLLTREGQTVIRLEPVFSKPVELDQAARRALLDDLSKARAAKAKPGPSAARSQDFLYDEDGLPI